MNKLVVAMFAALTAGVVFAHVPYIERCDYSAADPFVVVEPEHSIAVYGWLQSTNDVDYFTMKITNTTHVYVEILVPVAAVYSNFYPKFAIIGPGLPMPDEQVPVAIPAGQGAVVAAYDGTNRPTEYEPFGGKSYYKGPVIEDTVSATGTWQVVVWDPKHKTGDYVLAIGQEEGFKGPDWIRAIVNTRIIRKNGELHLDAVKARTSK
jgi:hypothetical protein